MNCWRASEIRRQSAQCRQAQQLVQPDLLAPPPHGAGEPGAGHHQHAQGLRAGGLKRAWLGAPERTRNGVICRSLRRVGKSAVQVISANDLPTGGIGAIPRALEHEREVGLSGRGELRFVVMEANPTVAGKKRSSV